MHGWLGCVVGFVIRHCAQVLVGTDAGAGPRTVGAVTAGAIALRRGGRGRKQIVPVDVTTFLRGYNLCEKKIKIFVKNIQS